MSRTKIMRPEKVSKLIEWCRSEILKEKTLGYSNYTQGDFETMEECLLHLNSYSQLLATVMYSGINNFDRDYEHVKG